MSTRLIAITLLFFCSVFSLVYGDTKDDRAISNLDEVIRLNPKNVSDYINRGKAYKDKKDYDHAIKDFNEAIRLDPKCVEAYCGRGGVYDDKKDYDRAIKDYDEAIRLDPKCVEAYCGRGWAYDGKKDYDQAIKDYDEAIRLNPKCSKAYCGRGGVYGDKKDYDRAIKGFDEAIRLDPKYVQAYKNRAWAFDRKGNRDLAIKDYNEIVRLDPKDVWAYNSRGWDFCSREDYDRAIKDFDEAIRLDPKYVQGYKNRAWAYDRTGNCDQAIKKYSEVIRLSPSDSWAYNNRGYIYVSKEDYDRAINDFDKAIQLDPKRVRTFYYRGLTHSIKANYEQAIKDYTEVIHLDPNTYDAYYYRGYAYDALANYDQAIKDYIEAIRLNVLYIDAYYGLANAYKHKREGVDFPASALSDIARKYGIEIVYADPVFPVKTSEGLIDGRHADKGQLADFVELFVKEFSLYPRTLTKHCKLKRIVLCKNLTYASQRYNGWYEHSRVLWCEYGTIYYDVSHPFPQMKQCLCGMIHHEIFHAIDFANDRKDIDDSRWSSLNPADFKYEAGGERVEVDVKAPMSEDYPGFLNRYSTTDVSEDKAEVFAKLITESAYIENRIRKDVVLRAKVARMKELVASLCPEMNEKFWTRAKQLDRPIQRTIIPVSTSNSNSGGAPNKKLD